MTNESLMQTAAMTMNQHQCCVVGEINFANVMAVYQQSVSLFAPLKEIEIDLAGARSKDSALLALLVEWLKLAKSTQQTIRFKNLSTDLQSVAKAAGMSELV